MSLYEVTAFTLNHNGPVRNLCLITAGALRYEERVVHNSTCKFGYEVSEFGAGRGVHLRCLHNNKYLVRQTGEDWITATANEPVEDTKRRDCTLFRVNAMSFNTMRWTHVSSNTLVAIAAPTDTQGSSYYLTIRPDNTSQLLCQPIDVERIIKLPKIVVFKDNNAKYLQVQNNQNLLFEGEDRHRKQTWFETFPVSNGDVRFRSVQNGKFVRRGNNNWIVADSDDTTSNNRDTLFHIARLNDKSIALVNQGNNRFCERFGDDFQFRAGIDTGVREAQLEIEEPIIERSIDVEYRLQDARIYDSKPRSWLSQTAFNDTKDRDLETQLAITYTESHTSSFHVTSGVETNFTAKANAKAGIPIIARAKAELEFTTTLGVDTTLEKVNQNTESYEFRTNVIIPPGKKRKARIMALEAKCDVPFSYVQTEVLANGHIIRTNLEDGVFRGMNGFEFHVQVYDPDEPTKIIFDEPVVTRYLPDTLAAWHGNKKSEE
ncbi:hypothetical protein RND81_14G218200 [Saponaria officinalis]|uniref:Agglutinin domain-containing protein n=2 Tax=Saponaria officinalis TaxID=3572 RepID=A0AAW1GS86_SAPOF